MPVHGALNLPDATVRFEPDFLGDGTSLLFQALLDGTPWSQPTVKLFGRTHPVPRLCCWMGEPDFVYTYSGVRNDPVPWSEPVAALRNALRAHLGVAFDGVLLNLYRNGHDHMGWHADDEPELGEMPTLASLSVGAVRRFDLRHRHRTELAVTSVELEHGSLLVMSGATQRHWRHRIAKTRRPCGPRINLTFRVVQHAPG